MLFRKNKNRFPKYYNEKEIASIETFITERFGSYGNVFHELVSPDIHLDVAIIDPTPERDHYTLVTMGAGAHIMNLPKGFPKDTLGRSELMIRLPPDWNIESDEERWYWPIRWLKIVARVPIDQDTWIGWGHTIPTGEPVAENTEFECMLLANPENYDESAVRCQLPNGDFVNFYQILPIYEDEMEFKINVDATPLVDLLYEKDIHGVVDIRRKSVVEELMEHHE